MKIIVLGDLHKRYDMDKPFYQRNDDFDNWFLNQEFNNKDNILIQAGDFFDKKEPSTKSINQAYHFVKGCKFKKIYIVSGNLNHEFSRIKRTYAIDSLHDLPNVELVKRDKLITIDNTNILLLPWIPDNIYNDIPNMKEYYEDLEYKNADYVVAHVEDEKYNFGEYVDFSKIVSSNCKRRNGHIHIKNDNYLGTPYITRQDEKDKDSYILSINSETKEDTFIKTPKLLDYYTVEYPNEIPKEYLNLKYLLLSVTNAPSVDIIEDMYKKDNIYFHRIYTNRLNTNDSNEVQSLEEVNLKELLDNYCKENKLSKDIQDECIKVLNKGEVHDIK